MDLSAIRVQSTSGTGILSFASAERPVCNEGEIQAGADGCYEVMIEAGKKLLHFLPGGKRCLNVGQERFDSE
ncbi:hypothetical protein [Paenibacillus alkalitolerans]|uniref:hypothetical protein n=1 Tax=Paenibacillus alkalitolerans TaxID=2799335 RepID=UPI0018F34E58|nr:hypothetical protein [Paenibacillus alkalitolerans]